MANCLGFKDLILVSESQSDNDYTRFMGGSSHILPFFGRLVECRQPWTNHLFTFVGRIYKPITCLSHDPSRRDKSWIAALFSGVSVLFFV